MALTSVISYVKLMLTRRNFDVIEERQFNVVKTLKNPNLNLLATKTETDEKIIVFFVEHTKVTIDVIKTIISTTEPDVKHVIICYAKSLTSDAKQAIAINKIFFFEIFSFDELSYDPIAIVPRHFVVENKPKEWKKLPIILTSDFVSRYYNFRKDDVIGIVENDCLSYRKCV